MDDPSVNSYLYSSVISVIYVIISILETRFSNTTEAKPLKEVFKNTMVVFFSSLCGFYILSNVNYSDIHQGAPTEIFTGNPEF